MKRILIAILMLAVLAILAGVAVFLMSREEAPVPVEEGYGAQTGSLGRPIVVAIDRRGAILVADDIGWCRFRAERPAILNHRLRHSASS